MESKEKYIILHKAASWRVKIEIGKIYVSRCFGFRNHGGIQGALKAAIEYRNEILKEHNLLEKIEKPATFQSYTTNKNVLVIGVRFVYNKYNKKGGTSYWVAVYSDKGKDKKKHYSIEKYGYDQAFLKACKTRYKYCGKLIIYNMDLLPCEPNVPYEIKEKTNEKSGIYPKRKNDHD